MHLPTDKLRVLLESMAAKQPPLRVVIQTSGQYLEEVTCLARGLPGLTSYILADPLRNQCCVDKAGAMHVEYDVFVKAGLSCFYGHQADHYILPQAPLQTESVKRELQTYTFETALVLEQQHYHLRAKLQGEGREVLALPFDRSEGQTVLAYGYHTAKKVEHLVVVSDQPHLFQQFNLIRKRLGLVSLHWLNSYGQRMQQSHRLLPTRLSLVFQAKEASVFGILLKSNCRHAVEVGRSLAKVCRSLGKKYFTFLMNNLNEVKLGNFSEIECYVLVSCSKQSLKTLKDYHRLVITPFDFLCAFDLGSLEDYHWDPCLLSFSQLPAETFQTAAESTAIQKLTSRQICENHILQTWDKYAGRGWKGLQLAEREVPEITQGKRGVAREYQSLAK